MNLISHNDISTVIDEHFSSVCPLLARPVNINGRIRKYHTNSVFEKILEKKNEYSGAPESNLFSFFEINYIEIITGKIDKLERLNYLIKRLMKTNRLTLKFIDPADGKLKKSKLHNDIVYCFNYDSYCDREVPYKILAELNISACPYCNRQFINTYHSTDGKTRATMDHFYSQSKYPFLSISFYNLIPSCYPCNMALKRDKKFTYQTHLNPYDKSFDDLVRFTIGYEMTKDNSRKYISEFYSNSNFLKIEVKDLKRKNDAYLIKAKNNIKDLKIIELYNLHKDFVVELIQKNVIYEKSGYANMLVKNYPKIFNDENDILRLLLGNYYYPEEYNKRPFSRLIHDISDELGLRKKILI